MTGAFCSFDKDENVIVALTEGKGIQLTKRDPDTGNAIGSSKEIDGWSGPLEAVQTIYGIVADKSPATDGSFYIYGSTLKAALKASPALLAASYVIKFASDLSLTWY